MRVICIRSEIKPIEHFPKSPLVDGDTYEVYQSPEVEASYRVVGFEYCPHCGVPVSFNKSRFIPLSEVDEDVIAAERTQTA